MIQIFENKRFTRFGDYGDHVYSDFEFRKCCFEGCRISMVDRPGLRSTVRNVRLLGCEVWPPACALDAAVVEDVLVEDLKTHGLFQSWGAVFKHVTLRGKIGRIMLSPAVATGTATPEQQRAFDEANAAYYQSVDWALDIREAQFQEGEIQGVPARLIRRDKATQVIVTREKALEGLWRKLDLSQTHWATSLEFLLNRNEPDVVLVAPKRHANYARLLDGLKTLRDAGVAEPD